jgi:hypothetical protein
MLGNPAVCYASCTDTERLKNAETSALFSYCTVVSTVNNKFIKYNFNLLYLTSVIH